MEFSLIFQSLCCYYLETQLALHVDLFWHRASPCSPGFSETHCVDPGWFKNFWHLPDFVSWIKDGCHNTQPYADFVILFSRSNNIFDAPLQFLIYKPCAISKLIQAYSFKTFLDALFFSCLTILCRTSSPTPSSSDKSGSCFLPYIIWESIQPSTGYDENYDFFMYTYGLYYIKTGAFYT